MKILVADDDPIQRERLSELLGAGGHAVVAVADGEQAWEALERDPEISLLVTDWLMPRLDGIDLCRRVRATSRASYLPVLLLTARDREEDLIEGLHAGADAFVPKPFKPHVLLAQLRVVERVLELEARLEQQIGELRSAHARLEADLSTAAAVQTALLPDASPKLPGVEFAWCYQACQQLGGDMFNVFRLDERRVGVYVLDVSGHGTPAALQSVSLSHALTPYDQQGGILKRIDATRSAYEVVPPAEVARELNRRFPLMARAGQYATFLYGVLDVPERCFRYVQAGHPPPIHLDGSGATAIVARGGGIPIGIEPQATWADEEIRLGAGDALVFYSDGVDETRDAEGEPFGLPRMLDALSAGRRGGARGLVDALHRRVEGFRKTEPRRDDVTVVALQLA